MNICHVGADEGNKRYIIIIKKKKIKHKSENDI